MWRGADALRRGADAIAVIGGADLYAQCMGLADRLPDHPRPLRPTGETRFPTIDAATWRAAGQTEHAAGPDDEAGFTVVGICPDQGRGGAAGIPLWRPRIANDKLQGGALPCAATGLAAL